ncbi:MAG: hypothetical protein LLG14_04850 [Nocardiaceae bacterium]|nr:hypothetical protein [Nocardiaceae bacterium]
MILWLAAAFVWCAVGARIGRVLVRQATPVRVAIAISVGTVALNTMLLMPDVAGTFDRVAGSEGLRQQVVEVLWALFAASTLTISEAARPILPKNRLRTWIFYVVVLTVTGVGLAIDQPLGWVSVFVAAVFAVVVGARHISWTVLGRAIGIYTAGVVGAAMSALYVIVNGYEPPAGLMALHNVLIATGSVGVLGEVWLRSLIVLIRIRRLHTVLTERFPDVLSEDHGHKTIVLRSSDHVAHIMDAIYLQSAVLVDLGVVSRGVVPPRSARERARSVVRWLVDPSLAPNVDTEWIAPPAGMSARRWVVSLATEFNRLASESGVTA